MAAVADHRRDRAFERLYARYVRDVYRYVLAVLRNPSEAEDVTQTTFLNAYRAMQAGEEPQKPHNWLIAIAHNACRSRIRFARRRPTEVPLDALVEQLEVPEAERPNIRELLHALGGLPFNQRAAITMRELEGRSHTEIAETLGVTVPAAEALIGRARRTLRSQAQAIKGLTVVQLPQSLRSVFRPGEAAGGAAGSAAIAKVVAVLAAGVVAGGVGLAGKGDAQSPAVAAQQPLATRVLVAVPVAQPIHARRAARVSRASVAAHRVAGHAKAPAYAAPTGRRPRFDTSGDTAPQDARAAHRADAPASTPSAAGAPSVPATATTASQTVQTATTATAATVAQTVTTATAAVTKATEPVQQVVNQAASAVTTVAAAVPPPPIPAPPAVPQPPPAPTVTIP